MNAKFTAGLLVITIATTGPLGAQDKVTFVATPDASKKIEHYLCNREPLRPSPFAKLPIGAIQPRGWLRKQLLLESEGFSGRLHELSSFLREEGNAWLSPTGEGHSGWEELPYWLKGYGDLGYVLGDERIIQDARKWLEAAIASQQPDGWFGPKTNRRSERDNKGKPDLWPNMVMLNALQSYYEYSGDQRVLDLMTKYFRWELNLPEADFLPGSWQQQRAGDNLASVYWLYNITGESWLLDLAKKIHRFAAPWEKGIPNWHGVNISQGFREPAIYYLQSGSPKHLLATEQNYLTVRDLYGNVPGGLYGADENCREGYGDPRQCAESCTMVEMMLSAEMLLLITGDPVWAERCEDVAFNSLPVSMTADLRALRYLSGPNHILSDRRNKSPGIQNGGPMFLYDPRGHRCCQHNMSHGWPYFAEHLWLAAPGNGLAAMFYAASQVKAKVGDGTEVTIVESTRYPFEETIELKLSTPKEVRFPLYLRVPRWCASPPDTLSPALTINDTKSPVQALQQGYLVVDRSWRDGDTVRLRFPMRPRLSVWHKNHDSVSVHRGPLTYSLRIGEKVVRVGGTDRWPATEIHPTTPWNYGLIVDTAKEAPDGISCDVIEKPWPQDDQPFTVEAAPIELRVKAKRIPQWQADELGLVGLLQSSPARSDEPVETVALIPMGCARLRIASFPTVGEGPNAHPWVLPEEREGPAASHCFEFDRVEAVGDGRLPKSSADRTIPRFTWWDHRGTNEWVAYRFAQPRKIAQVEVFWFDDSGTGQCRVPASWRVEWRDGQAWRPVSNATPCGVERDTFNKVTFEPITTKQIRLVVQLQPNYSAGILEWRVKE